MEKRKLKILYIGTDEQLEAQFSALESVDSFVIKQNSILAYNWLESNKPDAILCEVNLPGVSGFDVVKHLKQTLKIKKTPVILLHHQENEKIKHQAIEEKVDDLYFRPVKPAYIIRRINFLLDHDMLDLQKVEDTGNSIPEYKMPLAKRVFDILVAGTALLLLSPLLIIVMIAIKLESKGAVYYISKRVGTGYKVFDFYKFRSMYTGADAKLKELEHLNQYAKEQEEQNNEEAKAENYCPDCDDLGHPCSPILIIDGKEICENLYLKKKKEEQASTFKKIKNDPRVTKVGNIIRNTSIDELPQLINVLKGDMSIVGNRPLPLYEAEQLTSDDWSERFLAPAGITGLWQVELRGRKGDMSEDERKQLDNSYARNYSFWGDIKLILRTIPALLQEEKV